MFILLSISSFGAETIEIYKQTAPYIFIKTDAAPFVMKHKSIEEAVSAAKADCESAYQKQLAGLVADKVVVRYKRPCLATSLFATFFLGISNYEAFIILDRAEKPMSELEVITTKLAITEIHGASSDEERDALELYLEEAKEEAEQMEEDLAQIL